VSSSIRSDQFTSGGDRRRRAHGPRGPVSPQDGESRAVQELCGVPVGKIDPDPSRPGRSLDDTVLEALVRSVRERGVLRPVLVRPRPGADGWYRLIAGEQRWRAAGIAGLQTIPALVCRYDDSMTLERALIENMRNDNLSRVQNARVCATLVNEFGLTYEQVAARVGRSLGGVGHLMNLLDLSEEILELIEWGELGINHGRVLMLAKDPGVRGKLARKAVEKGWTVAVLEARACMSNEDPAGALDEGVPVPPLSDQAPDETGVAVARAWGDVLGAEVRVRIMARGRVRVEIRFICAEAALAAARRLGQAVSRGRGSRS
jgi:ParB family transcriptional regulator, chromosome partitioning protein